MKRMIPLLSVTLCLAGSAVLDKAVGAEKKAAEKEKVTFVSLLDEMTDLGRLAEHPGDLYKTRMASSYDRKSTDESQANEENWLANFDCLTKDNLNQLVRIDERDGEKEYVMFDAKGPGAVLRIWSAAAEHAGNVRIYIDGAQEPIIDMPFADFLSGTGPRRLVKNPKELIPPATPQPGNEQYILFPVPICSQRAMGWNCNLPIPYAKSCKIVTTESDQIWWYQVTCRDYRPDVKVESFSLELARKHWDKIERTAKQLAEPAKHAQPLAGYLKDKNLHESSQVQEVLPGRDKWVWHNFRDQAVYRFMCRIKAEDMEEALRGTLLKIYFDDKETPKVVTPLGDFFATAPGLNPYDSLPMTVREDGWMVCNWVMPARRAAGFGFDNTTAQPIEVETRFQKGDYDFTEDTMYFHAKWRQEKYMKSMPRRDWNFITIDGEGVYLGNMLLVTNDNRDWWGEGDEKIFFDGEKFPSIFGTGTEDYYSYACCSNIIFSYAYHNQPRMDGPGNSGHTCLSRFHIMDDMPFFSQLRFEMEIWHWDNAEISMAVTNYYYAFKEAYDNIEPIDPAELSIPNLPPADKRVGRNLFPDG